MMVRGLGSKRLGFVLAAVGAGWMTATLAYGQTVQSTESGGASNTMAVSQTLASTEVKGLAAAGSEVHQAIIEIEDLGERLARLTTTQRQTWTAASAALPVFCHDWERMLREREQNNLAHLAWHEQHGYETATYTGYGNVEACQAKESAEGVPIGKVTYQEMSYYLAGKTTDEAKSHPKVLSVTNTLEIFSWEKDRWFY